MIPESPPTGQSSEDMFQRAALFASGLIALRESPQLRALLTDLSQQLAMPIAGVCIVERGFCWMPVMLGMDVGRVPVGDCLSADIVQTLRGRAIPDLNEDPQFATSQMVHPPLSLRACAGAPLIGPRGTALGTVLVADRRPRPDLSDRVLPRLERAAEAIMAEAAAPHHLRRFGRTAVAELERLIRQAARDGDDELVRAIDRVMRDMLPHTGLNSL